MSRGQTLRALVNERLAAAAEDIFVLFERTIVEYEEELCRSEKENQRKQQLLDKVLSPKIQLVRGNVQVPSSSPGPGLDQEITETPWIKEEPEEESVKQEEEHLQVPVPESSAACVKTEESSLLPHREETQGEDISSETEGHTEHSSDTDHDDHWEPFRCSTSQMETEAEGDHNIQVQIRDESTKLGQDGRKHQCVFCNKGFGRKEDLQTHISVHTGEKPDSSRTEEEKEENTNKITKWAVTILRDFLNEKGRHLELNFSAVELNSILRDFYSSVQSPMGKHYSAASLMSIRAALNRFFTNFNIITDREFKSSNAALKSVIKVYRTSESETSSHHPRISEADLRLISSSPALSCDSPAGLVRKVWWDIQMCFARKGREENRQLTRSSFVVLRDEGGVEYVSLLRKPRPKPHSGSGGVQKENLTGFMLATPGDPRCPVASFKKYLSKCPDDTTAFYLHPKRNQDTQDEAVWFTKEPLGLNFLGNMMKRICEEVRASAPLSRIYTNQSLRSTALWRRSAAEFMSASGLRSYWAPPTEAGPGREHLEQSPAHGVELLLQTPD